jgi:hypothetical protein
MLLLSQGLDGARVLALPWLAKLGTPNATVPRTSATVPRKAVTLRRALFLRNRLPTRPEIDILDLLWSKQQKRQPPSASVDVSR